MPTSTDEKIALLVSAKLKSAEHRVYVARYLGRDIRAPSGKSCWASIGAAKNAVNLALESVVCQLDKGKPYDYRTRDESRKLLKDWIRRNIDFVELT